MSEQHAKLSFEGKTFDLPVRVGTENERGLDITALRSSSGLISLDEGYGNTGSCQSRITYIDGERGVLRYRGYPIEELVEHSTFTETAYLLIFGELPTESRLSEFRGRLTEHQFLHENMRHHFEGFPPNAPPMAILSAMINTAGCFQPDLVQPSDDEHFLETVARLMSKVRTIAAASYKTSIGQAIMYPRFDLGYGSNLLHMMFSRPNRSWEVETDGIRLLHGPLGLAVHGPARRRRHGGLRPVWTTHGQDLRQTDAHSGLGLRRPHAPPDPAGRRNALRRHVQCTGGRSHHHHDLRRGVRSDARVGHAAPA